MNSARDEITKRLEAALVQAGQGDQPPPPVTPCHDARFGDYQSNVAMSLGKKLGKAPRDVAGEIISKLKVDDLCGKVDVAGAGFINFHLAPAFVTRQVVEMAGDARHGIASVSKPRRIVVDFSSPNTAKAMHVGHIRSTFLGDALARIARGVGHPVITDNHLGDWGTNFGMIIHGYKTRLDPKALDADPIAEFERLYVTVKAASEADPAVLQSARQELARLHAGDAENGRIWKEITRLSLVEFENAYTRLGVKFDHTLGESFYNPMLQGVVDELKKLGVAEMSEGATCIFFRDDAALKDVAPMIVQKSDGAFLYATTDLATVRYRVQEWKSEEILYVTDARQRDHFRQVFSAVKKWSGAAGSTFPGAATPSLKHVVFGSILGPDRKPFKTRSGGAVKLTELLDEAESRARKIIEEKNPDLDEAERAHAARVIGIGAVKYADLSQNRDLDYVFDWNKLLALQGNTAPYLIYAYVRMRSILRSGGATLPSAESLRALAAPEELSLAKHLIQFSDAVHAVLEDHRPHLLTTYLYELAARYSQFYEACPVLKAEEPMRSARLGLCDLTSSVLRSGLNLLGIGTLEKM